MKRNIVIIVCVLLIAACKKEEKFYPPVIDFKTGSLYTVNGDTAAVGHSLYFGITARGNGSDLTNFTIKKYLADGQVITMMDTAIYTEYLDVDKVFYQNVEDVATWKFTVMDRNRLSSEISLTVFKDPNSTYGGIFYFPSITLGFQNNTVYGHFLDPFTGITYKSDSSDAHFEDIEMLCYFKNEDVPPSAVLSSPGEMDNFSTDAQTLYPQIVNWTTRHYTLWDISLDNGNNTPLTTNDFDAAQNDSLLIVSFHEIWGKKKFKYATAGKIIPFKTAGGKLGLIKVISADENDSGKIELALKIQQ
ncbi:MAG: hypothetical protein BWY70_00132 [Bacteroidetes bacterium ADurb.Bin408]|nr:MAG: hypothetical protein BWY70_00132 [Bacteroidetes bacterium ADurb.Bin408]